VLGDHWSFYGGRGSYGLLPGLWVFTDLGLIDAEGFDTGLGFQGGAMYALPIKDLPFEAALRCTAGMGLIPDVTTFGVCGMAVASRGIDPVKGLSLYGGGGLALTHTRCDVKVYHWDSAHGYWETQDTVDDNQADLALAAGAVFEVSKQVSLYAEISHVDDLFVGAGARLTF